MSLGAPLLLVDSRNIGGAQEYARANGIDKAAVLGGDALITDMMVDQII